MLGTAKSLFCSLGSFTLMAIAWWFDVPVLSRFPGELGFLLMAISFFAWRPVYLPVPVSDQFEDVLLKDALSRHPSAAAAFLLGLATVCTASVVSIVVRLLMA
jgi:hypothetical protein